MEYDHTISGLLRKRVEIAQGIERNGRELVQLRDDLAAIDGALQVFGVAKAPAPPKLHEKQFRRGEIPRLIYAELRVRPMTAEQLVKRAIAIKGKDADSLTERKSVLRSVSTALKRMERDGCVRSASAGNALLWEMVRR